MKKMKKNLAILSAIALIPLFSMGQAFPTTQDIIERAYYENGQLKTLIHSNGSESIVINYYEDGQIKDRSTYVGLNREGNFESWHSNGKQSVAVSYSNNVPDGQWTSYDENGRMIGSAFFEAGELKGGSMWGNDGRIVASRD